MATHTSLEHWFVTLAPHSTHELHPHIAGVCALQLPIVKAACCKFIEDALNEETVPSSLEIAERCDPHSTMSLR